MPDARRTMNQYTFVTSRKHQETIIDSIACPACGAAKGAPCTTAQGRHIDAVHTARHGAFVLGQVEARA